MKYLKKIIFLIFALLNQINLHFKLRIIGNYIDQINVFLLKAIGAKIGQNSFVRSNVLILKPENLIIGNNSTIGSNSELFNYAEIIIGDNVDIGTQLYINTNNHKIDDPSRPLAYQGAVINKISIGSDVWIGARVTILSGVEIKKRVVVGAGSVVTSDLESGYVYGGVPAKKIKKLII